jgi:hypothetical protein
MNTYKITNKTKELEKRSPYFNTDVILNYVDGMLNKKIVLKPEKFVYLTINSLPISIHRLQLDGLVQITNHPKLTQKPKTEKVEPKKTPVKKAKQSVTPIKKGEVKKKIVETSLSGVTKKESKPEEKTEVKTEEKKDTGFNFDKKE